MHVPSHGKHEYLVGERNVCVLNGQQGGGGGAGNTGLKQKSHLLTLHNSLLNFNTIPALLYNTYAAGSWFIHSKAKTNMKMQTLYRLLLKC